MRSAVGTPNMSSTSATAKSVNSAGGEALAAFDFPLCVVAGSRSLGQHLQLDAMQRVFFLSVQTHSGAQGACCVGLSAVCGGGEQKLG